MPQTSDSFSGLVVNAWGRCRQNLRINLIAGLVIWLVGVSVCYAYWNIEEAKSFFFRIAEAKKEYGYLYSACATAVFGGVIPFLFLLCTAQIERTRILKTFFFFLFFWAYKGVEVDAFYRLQTLLVGGQSSFWTVFTKVVIDQFVYCIIWSAPLTAIFYGWKDAHFSWKQVEVLKKKERMIGECFFLLISTWIIWTPAVSIVYSMPSDLQIPLFNLTLCFFVLVITVSKARRVAG